MTKLYIHYCPVSGIALADDNIEGFILKKIKLFNSLKLSKGDDQHIYIGNELILNCFRVFVKRKVISHEDLVIVVNEKNYYLNKDARYINEHPYTKHNFSYLEELL